MSYEAARRLKEHIELEVIRNSTPEELNGALNNLSNQIDKLKDGIKKSIETIESNNKHEDVAIKEAIENLKKLL